MKNDDTWRVAARLLLLLTGLSILQLHAQNDESLDGVLFKSGQAYGVRGEQSEILTNTVKLPFDVEVSTNGTFKVGNGQERKFEEGQMIRSDGWLINSEGLVQPVFDFLWMQGGRVMVVRDGVATPLGDSMTFTNNLCLSSDGTCRYPNGARSRTVDGQIFGLDGAFVPSKDAATFKNGRMVVQKDATLFPLRTSEIMGMNDGTAVYGDGTIKRRDGTTVQVREDQTVLLEGVATPRF